MKSALRVVASLAIAAVAASAIVRLCWQPWLCNQEEGRVEKWILKNVDSAATISVRIAARGQLERIDGCIRADPTIVNRYMLKAALLRMLNRPAEAAETYRDALRIDRRPELWLGLGETQLQTQQIEPAIENLMNATLLSIHLISDIPEPYFSRIQGVVYPTLVALLTHKTPPISPHELRLRLQRDPW